MPAAKPTPEETFVWVVTKTDMRWSRSELGTPALTREVAALRCGLDAASWEGEGAAKCAGLLGLAPDKARIRNAPLPFDLSRAHALYTALFGQLKDLIHDKHLLIVPSGPLSQLPFQVLVTASSADAGYRSAAWLARQHAITVLPAVSSLKALRRVAKPSAATKAMIGFGNPLLDGDPAERPWEAEWAKLARQKQACPQTPSQHVAALFERRRGVVPMATRSGRADLNHLRSQSPLHDTADELCAVAKDLKLPRDDIVLGARATEAMIKSLSEEGRLANYRVLHFATHGTLSGEITGTSEPGLILTPPAEQSDVDDGYLSASEVAALKLDADWIILSACNTAAGGAQGAEALSGLARSFFYAGARALLVSHWSVDSAATVKLITSTVGVTTRDKTLSRAEALRRAMLAMIDKGEPHEAHPAYWAPFVVVGEGAAEETTRISPLRDRTSQRVSVKTRPSPKAADWKEGIFKQ
jgi:CHAT domain-containing protein